MEILIYLILLCMIGVISFQIIIYQKTKKWNGEINDNFNKSKEENNEKDENLKKLINEWFAEIRNENIKSNENISSELKNLQNKIKIESDNNKEILINNFERVNQDIIQNSNNLSILNINFKKNTDCIKELNKKFTYYSDIINNINSETANKLHIQEKMFNNQVSLLNDKIQEKDTYFLENQSLLTKIISTQGKEIISSPFDNINFNEALDGKKLVQEIKRLKLSEINSQLIDSTGISVSKGSQLIDSVIKANNNEIIWKLSEEGKKLLKDGKIKYVTNKQGKYLPTLQDVDVKKGRWKINIRGAKISKVAKITKLANVAVGAAHIISGIDMMNKIKHISGKIDFLTEGRKIDKLSELKKNFQLSKEILSKPFGSIEKFELVKIHNNIYGIRENWFMEIFYKLDNIQDPNSLSFFSRILTTTKAKDKRVSKKVSEFEEEMYLINASIEIDFALCSTIDYEFSMSEDLNNLNKLYSKLEEKSSYLSGKNDLSINNYLVGVKNLKKKVDCLNIIEKRKVIKTEIIEEN